MHSVNTIHTSFTSLPYLFPLQSQSVPGSNGAASTSGQVGVEMGGGKARGEPEHNLREQVG